MMIITVRDGMGLKIHGVKTSGLRRSRVPSRPAGRDPGRDGTGFFKGIFEKPTLWKLFKKLLE